MDSSHETLDDAKVIVDDLGQGGEAVGGAARVGDDLHRWVVGVLVDSHDEHGGIWWRGRDDHLLSAALFRS